MADERFINGIDVQQLSGAIDGIKHEPELGKYTFRVKNEWINGAHCRTWIKDFSASGQEDTSRTKTHVIEGDEPPVLLGTDHGPNATEAFLHALGASLNASFIYHAAACGINIESLEFDVEGYLDLNGFLGTDETVPSNFQKIHVTCRVKADAPHEKLDELWRYAQKRSPVFNTVVNPMPVQIVLETRKTPIVTHMH